MSISPTTPVVEPVTFTVPVPFGVRFRLMLVSSPVAATLTGLPVAEFVTVSSLTADDVAGVLMISLPFVSLIAVVIRGVVSVGEV